MKNVVCGALATLALWLPSLSHAYIACERNMQRCTNATCGGGSQVGTDWLQHALPATNKSPAYSPCPNPLVQSTCTNDFWRVPSNWDYTTSTADFIQILYSEQGYVAAGLGYVQIYDRPLSSAMTGTQWANVASISYVDIDVAWSTETTSNSIQLEWQGVQAAAWSGNYPSGTLVYVRMGYDPSTGNLWAKAQFDTVRSWIIENAWDITSATPGVRVHSITETVGFQYNGGGCP